MKIISINNRKYESKRFYCTNCSALFEAEPEEYILMENGFRDKKERFRCYCPNCGMAVYRLTEDVPDDELESISL